MLKSLPDMFTNLISGGIAGLGEGINLCVLLHGIYARLRIAVDDKTSPAYPHAERARSNDEIAIWHVPMVPGWQQKILPTFALVGPGYANVPVPVVPDVINESEYLRRCFDHDRTVAEVHQNHV